MFDELRADELEQEGFGEPLPPELLRRWGAATLADLKALLD